VEDFVAFITVREHDRALTRAAATARAPTFAAIWNNPEDDAYDAIWVLVTEVRRCRAC